MTLQPGDKVRVVNGERDWVVLGVGATAVYLAAVGQPSWAPQRFPRDLVTHVLRGNEWVAISQLQGDPDCGA